MAYVQYPKPRPTLSRARAEQLLERVVAAARQVNTDPRRYPLAVAKLAVFGSYLSEKDPIGDLDLAVDLRYARPPSEFLTEHRWWRPVHWADRTLIALRVRQPKLISIHLLMEVEKFGTPMKMVFVDSG